MNPRSAVVRWGRFLNGIPLLALSVTPTSFLFTFNRVNDSESDTTQTFQYGTIFGAWTDEIMSGTAPIGLDMNGITVGMAENAAAPDSTTLTIPRGLNTTLFGRLQVAENR